MKSDWSKTTLGTCVHLRNGKKRPVEGGTVPVYGGNGILNYTNQSNNRNCIIIGRVGAYCGCVFRERGACWVSDNAISAIAKDNVDIDYIYFFIKNAGLNRRHIGTSQPLLTQEILNSISIRLPPLTIQKKIAAILSILDEKIATNLAINDNLEQQVLAMYRSKFIDTTNAERTICRADEFFDISIGKTPPRKESQWFSNNPEDVTWVSISDMGSCGLYIRKSSERLTQEAVKRFNIKVVPDNTVLLSFKLTVGRIAITNGEMTTNEAIAHFKTDCKNINEYLYCYLRCFNFETMGSTSSIATAVNSKIIRGMPFVVPANYELKEFHDIATPMFEKIKANQIEIDNLTALRDTLLPKLMSGELDVSTIER